MVIALRLYLARAGYTAGPLFRASINGSGGPLSYDAAHHRWGASAARPGSPSPSPGIERVGIHHDKAS
jgi:integrase/recombinase XerD